MLLLQALTIRDGDALLAADAARFLPTQIVEATMLSETVMEAYLTLHNDSVLTDTLTWGAVYVSSHMSCMT